jgi:CubicO group peptidase (beta-lactamase class C family)
LLYHRSGLPAFIPFFAPALLANPELLTPSCPAELRARVRAEVVRLAASTPLEHPPRERAVYSDIGFILLGEALAAVAGTPLDEAFATRIAQKLELGLHFRRLSAPARIVPLASTGTTRPREPAPGQEGMWPKLPSVPSRPGEVDDDNAWVMDGVAGHAGLFGTAQDVARFGQAVLDELDGARRIAPPELWRMAVRRDPDTPGSTRALGFDTPSDQDSAAGSKLGKLPDGAVGHLGFTGTTLFIDLGRHLVVALNTNRTLLGRHEVRIREFRPRFHDAAVDATGG